MREGEQLISAALEQLRQLGTSSCSDAELVQRFSEIRQRADIKICSNRLEPVEALRLCRSALVETWPMRGPTRDPIGSKKAN